LNNPTESSLRLDPQILSQYISNLLQESGMTLANAQFLTNLLIKNDLRGVFSHGSIQAADYIRLIRDKQLNPNPQVKQILTSPSLLEIDGDGGLGYFAAYQAANDLVELCRTTGIAAAVTRNHGHFGAAGIYARLLSEHGLFGYVTSGHQLSLTADQSIMRAAGGSPMSFALPAGDAPAMVLDFGAMHDLYAGSPHVSELFQLAPGLIFRSMGLGFMCQVLGGFLAGIPLDEARSLKQYQGANQGSLLIALDISRFIPLDQFKQEMDGYMQITQQMQPMHLLCYLHISVHFLFELVERDKSGDIQCNQK